MVRLSNFTPTALCMSFFFHDTSLKQNGNVDVFNISKLTKIVLHQIYIPMSH